MLKITVELIPFGVEADRETIMELDVINVYTDPKDVADYGVEVQYHSTNKHYSYPINRHSRRKGASKLLARVFEEFGRIVATDGQ
jgi:hypothetical protein